MRKSRREIRTGAQTPLMGMFIIVLAVLCLLVFLWAIMIVVRVVLG